MKKKIVTIEYQGKPIFVCKVEEVEIMHYLTKKKEAEKNLQELIDREAQTKNTISVLYGMVGKCESDIAELKGEK